MYDLEILRTEMNEWCTKNKHRYGTRKAARAAWSKTKLIQVTKDIRQAEVYRDRLIGMINS